MALLGESTKHLLGMATCWEELQCPSRSGRQQGSRFPSSEKQPISGAATWFHMLLFFSAFRNPSFNLFPFTTYSLLPFIARLEKKQQQTFHWSVTCYKSTEIISVQLDELSLSGHICVTAAQMKYNISSPPEAPCGLPGLPLRQGPPPKGHDYPDF